MATKSDQRAILFRLFTEIGIISNLANAEFQQVLPKHLNQSEFSVLNHFVRVGDGKTPSRLARIFQMAKPSMTSIVAKLERRGYVRVEPAPEDKRSKFVWITDEGRLARDNAIAALEPLLKRLTSEFDVDQLDGIMEPLAALRDYLDHARDERDGLA